MWVKTCIASRQVHLLHFMFVFTLQIAMATVTMEILRLFVKHHFLIVSLLFLVKLFKKNNI